MTFITQKTKLVDCDSHSPRNGGSITDGLLHPLSRSLPAHPDARGRERQIDGTVIGRPLVSHRDQYRELFLVEGDSASKSVVRIRDSRYQAVLPMQGKPMNATKASDAAVRKNQWYAALIDALGGGWHAEDFGDLRYDRILFLFDPDADGIHCGALMLLFFDEYLQPLLDANRVSVVRPPLFEIRADGYSDSLQATSEDHLQRIKKVLTEKGIRHSHHRYRGLASLSDATLSEYCVDPSSRTAYLLQRSDARSARAIFGRKPPREQS